MVASCSLDASPEEKHGWRYLMYKRKQHGNCCRARTLLSAEDRSDPHCTVYQPRSMVQGFISWPLQLLENYVCLNTQCL